MHSKEKKKGESENLHVTKGKFDKSPDGRSRSHASADSPSPGPSAPRLRPRVRPPRSVNPRGALSLSVCPQARSPVERTGEGPSLA